MSDDDSQRGKVLTFVLRSKPKRTTRETHIGMSSLASIAGSAERVGQIQTIGEIANSSNFAEIEEELNKLYPRNETEIAKKRKRFNSYPDKEISEYFAFCGKEALASGPQFWYALFDTIKERAKNSK